MFKTAIWQQFWVRSIKGQMKQGFLILNQGWGKGPTSCRGNDYKWSLQLRHPLLQQLPFWLAWFSPFLTENCCWKHFTLQFDSSVSSIKLNFLALTFEALCSLGSELLAFVFILFFPSWGLFTGILYPWKGSLISCQMTTDESCSLVLL